MFITIEGIDCCGKTTQARMMVPWLERYGSVFWTREPGGWDGGAALRSLLLSTEWQGLYSELLLFLADRCEHTTRVIAPHLERGSIVLCDRYHDSTFAYQCFGGSVPVDVFDTLSFLVPLTPDFTVILDVEPTCAADRLAARGGADAFEARGAEYLARVRAGYLCAAERYPRRCRVIDGTGPEETVHGRITEALREVFAP